jgi:hypothetical protein
MKNGTAYGTTEDTEKDSVSSRKKIKRQRHLGVGNRPLVEGEAVLGGYRDYSLRGHRGEGMIILLIFWNLHNFSGFSVVIF